MKLTLYLAAGVFAVATLVMAQAPAGPALAQVKIAAPSPPNDGGFFLLTSGLGAGVWTPLTVVRSSKSKIKHGFLSSLSSGAVAAEIVADYAGAHAAANTSDHQPVVCVAHVGLDGPPFLVRLKELKSASELDMGKLRALPFTGQVKLAQVEPGAEIPLQTDRVDTNIVLYRPAVPLPDGEYAIMFGAGNTDILPFTIASTVK